MNRFNWPAMSDRERKLLIGAGAVLGAAVVFNGLLVPLWHGREEFRNAMNREENIYRQNQLALIRSRQWQEKYTPALERFRRTETNEQIISAMVSEAESAAKEAGLRIAEMKPQKVKTESFVHEFGLSLGVEGPLPEVMAFIYRLQSEPHIFRVETLRMQKQMNKQGEVSCQLTLNRTLIDPKKEGTP